jgi:hypothetical protein
MPRSTIALFLAILLALFAPLVSGAAMADTEEPSFTVVSKDGDFEIRDYAGMIVAETEVAGDRDSAVSAGFRILASYIFGGNAGQNKIAMTAPVTQIPEMVAGEAVSDGKDGAGAKWRVRFSMPQSYSMATLPKPDDARIKLIQVPSRRIAALRFSGLWSDGNLKTHREELTAALSARKLKAKGAPAFAFYDPPWKPFFWRRNEILQEIETH